MLTRSRSYMCAHARITEAELLNSQAQTRHLPAATCQAGKAEAAGLKLPGDARQEHHQGDWSPIVLLHLTIRIRKGKGLGVGKCAEKIGS